MVVLRSVGRSAKEEGRDNDEGSALKQRDSDEMGK